MRKRTATFGKLGKAQKDGACQHDTMLAYDSQMRRARFEFAVPAAATVHLLVGQSAAAMDRVPMQKRDDRWVASVPLPPGLYCYAFEVDGRVRNDRVATVRTRTGRRCTLAVLA